MIGYHGGASAAVAQLPSWQAALQGLSAPLSGAIASNPVAAGARCGSSARRDLCGGPAAKAGPPTATR
jgi:hypothetical protein